MVEPKLNNSANYSQEFDRLLTDELLEQVNRPAQYLGNEWGTRRRDWNSKLVHMALAFPDLYELGMSNFGQRILYQIVNRNSQFMCDRAYAPGSDMEALLRERNLPLWGWESRVPLHRFELIGFSLSYELTYTNVLNMLDLSFVPVKSAERKSVFPLVFGGGPSAVNPEPMAMFMDFLVIGDGEEVTGSVLEVVASYKRRLDKNGQSDASPSELRSRLLADLAINVPGVYVPSLYRQSPDSAVVKPITIALENGLTACPPERVVRQVVPLTDDNQPTNPLVPYLSLVHDRQVLEVRRGCDRGCRFCQPGYTFLPVRERSTSDLVRLSKEALDTTGYQEYSMLSLCVSDYTSLSDSMRALNQEHSRRRASMSFPSQRADRMNLDMAEEMKVVRKSGITLAPEAGTERLRAVINKGLNHGQIISAIESAYQAGWTSIKLYFMIGLPTEDDRDLAGIIEILKEGTNHCRAIRSQNPSQHRRDIGFTCTISNTVPKPHTPFQWYGQIAPEEIERRQKVLRDLLKQSRLRNVTLNFTSPGVSLLEAAISRGGREAGNIIYRAWQSGAVFDAWDEHFQLAVWDEAARQEGRSLAEMACTPREVGSSQPFEIVHTGVNNWWLKNEWEKAMAESETAPCTENLCHACGVCTELNTTHLLSSPKLEVLKKNPFVKELAAHSDEDSHPSLFFMKPQPTEDTRSTSRFRFEFTKRGDLRFISHLDLLHLFARALRRSGISVAYSQGFNPGPKISLAVSLPLFQEALAEVGEVELADDLSPSDLQSRLNSQLPDEIQVTRVKPINSSGPSLASVVGRALYRAEARAIPGCDPNAPAVSPHTIKTTITHLLSQPSLFLKGKEKAQQETCRDIRSGIYSLTMESEHPIVLACALATGSQMHVKPSDLVELVCPEIHWRITRIGLTTPDGTPLFELS